MELAGVRTVIVPAAIDAAGAASLTRAVSAALADETVFAVVLQGTATEFCRGMDISMIDGREPADAIARSIGEFARGLGLLAQSAKPTLAVVGGPALGGGLGLAAACDVVVAARSATFGLPEGLLGLTPAVIASALLERITSQQFKRLTLLAEPVTADEARTCGLVDEVVEDDALQQRARRLCRSLLRVHPGTKRGVLDAVAQTRAGSMDAAIRWGVEETARASATPDVRERISRFLEGGAPWQKP